MKTSHYKIIGIVLLAAVLLAAIVFQIFGSGLVTTHPPAPPHAATTSQGYPVTVIEGTGIVFHLFTILPLTGAALLGVACLLRARTHETNA
jgi:hypothetical protein